MIIFVDENIPYLKEALAACGKIITFKGRELTNSDLINNNCHALFTRATTSVNEWLLVNTDVKFVGTATSGYDHIDRYYLKKKRIQFAYAPGSNANSVAELVVYSILKWAKKQSISVKGKTIGVIGYGHIGRIVAEYALRMGMKVIVNDPPLKSENYKFPDNLNYDELDELCKSSDIITNHVPFTIEGEYPTYKLIDEKIIGLMTDGTLLIHTSRGGIVDEKPLKERLKSGTLEAVIDVWDNEPLIDIELARLAMLSTPHIGGYSRDGKISGALALANAFKKYSGKKPDTKKMKTILSEYKPLRKTLFKQEDYLCYLLSKSRNFEFDDNELRASLYWNDKDRAYQFDLMRMRYPKRREKL